MPPLVTGVEISAQAPDEVWVHPNTLQSWLPDKCVEWWRWFQQAVGTGLASYRSRLPDYLGDLTRQPSTEDPYAVFGEPEVKFPDVVAHTGREAFVHNFTDVASPNLYGRWHVRATVAYDNNVGIEGECRDWFAFPPKDWYFQGFQPRLKPLNVGGGWCVAPGPSIVTLYNRKYHDGGMEGLPSYSDYPPSYPRGPALLSGGNDVGLLDGSVTIQLIDDPFLEDPSRMPPITVPPGISPPGPLLGGVDCSEVSPSVLDAGVIATSLEGADASPLQAINTALSTINLFQPYTLANIFPLMTQQMTCDFAAALYAATGIGAVDFEVVRTPNDADISPESENCGKTLWKLTLPKLVVGDDVQMSEVNISQFDCSEETGQLEPVNRLYSVVGDNVQNMREIFQLLVTKLDSLLQCCPPCNSSIVRAHYCVQQGEWFKQDGIEKIVVAVKTRQVATDIRDGNPNIEKLGWFCWLSTNQWLPLQERWIDYDRQEFRPAEPHISGFAIIPAPGVTLNIAVYLDAVYTVEVSNPQSARNENQSLDWNRAQC